MPKETYDIYENIETIVENGVRLDGTLEPHALEELENWKQYLTKCLGLIELVFGNGGKP